MKDGHPSLTARGAAGHRAAHQLLDGGAIFRDPFARRILGEEACAEADARATDPDALQLRLFVAARSRFAEDALGAAVQRGVRQAVVLGAGLDTFALRNPHASLGLRVFEVDHPATQAWKRARLTEAGLEAPASLTFAPVDFERESLADGLARAGFDARSPAFFLWLGVVPYLPQDAVRSVLGFVAVTPGDEIAFDYTEALENHPPQRRARAQALARRVAALGEPIRCFLDPETLARELSQLGFDEIEDLDAASVARRYFRALRDTPESGGGPHLIRARRS